jgi:hypothetical protein
MSEEPCLVDEAFELVRRVAERVIWVVPSGMSKD